jgi:hypothetical protein
LNFRQGWGGCRPSSFGERKTAALKAFNTEEFRFSYPVRGPCGSLVFGALLENILTKSEG